MGVPGADAATAALAKGSWETLMRTYETSVRQEKYVQMTRQTAAPRQHVR